MPQYLMSVWHDDDYDVDFSSPDAQRLSPRSPPSTTSCRRPAPGCSAAGSNRRRRPPSSAAAAAQVSMIDGPYAETKEQMGGFWVIEAADLDAALDWAGKAAAACEGPVELRPMQDGSDGPRGRVPP